MIEIEYKEQYCAALERFFSNYAYREKAYLSLKKQANREEKHDFLKLL